MAEKTSSSGEERRVRRTLQGNKNKIKKKKIDYLTGLDGAKSLFFSCMSITNIYAEEMRRHSGWFRARLSEILLNTRRDVVHNRWQ